MRLSIRPFDDSDDPTISRHEDEVCYDDTEAPIYSSGSVIWKSSSEAILDMEMHPQQQLLQQRGSATDSCSSEQSPPDADGRRLSERGMVSSTSSDFVLSSDCSASSDQLPLHQVERDDQQSSSRCAVATAAVFSSHTDPPITHTDSSLSENTDVPSRSPLRESETVPGGTDSSPGKSSLLDEINDHLKQAHGRELISGSAAAPGTSGNAVQRSPDDVSLLDIDTALAEVMSGLELLGRSRGLSLDRGGATGHPAAAAAAAAAVASSTSSSPAGRVASPRTPDLVVGLPQFGSHSAASPPRSREVTVRSPSLPPAAGQLTSAEMFASVDRCTIKKSTPGSSSSAPSSAEIWTSPAVHPLRAAVDSRSSSVGGEVVSELPGWPPVRSFGDGGGVRARGSPARSQSCRGTAAERQSDQTWSTLWTASSEVQRDRDFFRAIAPPQSTGGNHQPTPPLPSPGREDGVSFDRTELPRFSPSASAAAGGGTGSRRDVVASGSLTQGFVATLPRDATHGPPKTPVKVKPPVMKKPARSSEMMRRLNEYQQLTDSSCSALPK